jgi:hypothetical protein
MVALVVQVTIAGSDATALFSGKNSSSATPKTSVICMWD